MPAPRQSLVRKAFGVVAAEPLGDRQIRVRVSTDQIDRSGDVVVQKGIDVRNFMLSKTVLWNHDQDHPVASCQELGLENGQLVGLAQFPPAGVSAKADEVYGLAKAGVINAASIGFLPGEVEPVDGKNPRNGLRINTCELMEFSFVSVPANSGAEVLQRAFRGEVRQTTRPITSRKGMFAVSELAWLLQMLGYQVDASLAERAREGDSSTVPDQLADALRQLGAALVAMTGEEVAELLAGQDDSGLDDCPVMMCMLEGFRAKGAANGTGALAKAGRRISASTDDAMRGHLAKVAQGVATVQAGHGEMVKMLDAAKDGSGDEGGGDPEDDDPDRMAAAAQARRGRELETLRLA